MRRTSGYHSSITTRRRTQGQRRRSSCTLRPRRDDHGHTTSRPSHAPNVVLIVGTAPTIPRIRSRVRLLPEQTNRSKRRDGFRRNLSAAGPPILRNQTRCNHPFYRPAENRMCQDRAGADPRGTIFVTDAPGPSREVGRGQLARPKAGEPCVQSVRPHDGGSLEVRTWWAFFHDRQNHIRDVAGWPVDQSSWHRTPQASKRESAPLAASDTSQQYRCQQVRWHVKL